SARGVGTAPRLLRRERAEVEVGPRAPMHPARASQEAPGLVRGFPEAQRPRDPEVPPAATPFSIGSVGSLGAMLERNTTLPSWWPPLVCLTALLAAAWPEIWFPARDSVNQEAPNAVMPWPLVWPAFVS